MMANRTETDQERLERLTALMADGWCPCRSSDDDAGWMAERLAAAWEEVACLRREKSDLTRERDVARADWGAAVMGAEAESNRADRAEVRALAAEQERDRRSDEAKYLADDVHQLEAERAALHTMIQTLEDRESQAPGLAARSPEPSQEVAAELARLRTVLATTRQNVEAMVRSVDGCITEGAACSILAALRARAELRYPCRSCDCRGFHYEVGEHPGVCDYRHGDSDHGIGLQAMADAGARTIAERDRLRTVLAAVVKAHDEDVPWDAAFETIEMAREVLAGLPARAAGAEVCTTCGRAVNPLCSNAFHIKPEQDHTLHGATKLARLTALAHAVRDEVECPSCGGCDDLSPCLRCAAKRALAAPRGPDSETT